MVLTSMSVVGHPSVLYCRRIHPSSKYQPGRSLSRSWICASSYVASFLRVDVCVDACDDAFWEVADCWVEVVVSRYAMVMLLSYCSYCYGLTSPRRR